MVSKPHEDDKKAAQNPISLSKSLPIVFGTSIMQRSNCLPSCGHMALGAQGNNYYPTIPSHPTDLHRVR